MRLILDATPQEYLNFLHSGKYHPSQYDTPFCAWCWQFMEDLNKDFIAVVQPDDHGFICVEFQTPDVTVYRAAAGPLVRFQLPEWARPIHWYYERRREQDGTMPLIPVNEAISDLYSCTSELEG